MEYSELELQHSDILKQVNVMCRSNKFEFTDDTRLKVIDKLLEESSYKCNYHGSLCRIYSKKPIEELGENIILVSSHVDTVHAITECSSSLDEEKGIFRGTYDNTITNASEVILMQEENLPDNIVFAFTGEEESCNCKGALEAAEYIKSFSKNLFCVALDVTYEGFDTNRLWTIENCVPCPKKERESNNLNIISDIALSFEPECQTFDFIKAGKKHIPDNLPEQYLTHSESWYDEAAAYRKAEYPTLSICIPCGRGEMHSNYGVAVKQPVFEGYLLSLTSFLYRLNDRLSELIIGETLEYSYTHEGLLDAYKIARQNLMASAETIQFPAYSVSKFDNYFYKNFGNDYDYEDEEYEDEDNFERASFYINNAYEPLLNKISTDDLYYLFNEAYAYAADEIDDYIDNVPITDTMLHDLGFSGNTIFDLSDDETLILQCTLAEAFDKMHKTNYSQGYHELLEDIMATNFEQETYGLPFHNVDYDSSYDDYEDEDEDYDSLDKENEMDAEYEDVTQEWLDDSLY